MVAKPPVAVLIGRTNVGKSSLFNAMIEEQKSLVSDIPGTTRDRFEANCLWRGRIMRVMDTGGLDVDTREEIERNIVLQAKKGLEQADCIFFVVDLTVGPTADDLTIAKELLSRKGEVIVVGNKADTGELRLKPEGPEWKNWPLARPLAVSAAQGTGVGDLLDAAFELLKKHGKSPIDVEDVLPMRVAVLGEPNVGKSTLLNAMLGDERFITANVPHTTREPNDALIEMNGRTYLLIDTAGMRKSASMKRSGTILEKEGVERTMNLLKRADVALLILDATKGVTAQDRHLAGLLSESRLSAIIVVNKWDLVENKTTNTVNTFEDAVRGWLPQLKYAPVIFTSALTGQRAKKLFPLIDEVFHNRFTELSDEEAKSFMSRAIGRHKPIRGKGVKHPHITKFFQASVNPPRFVLSVDLPRQDSLSVSYVRFLENLLREYYTFTGTPIFIRISAGRKSHTTH